MYIHGITLPNSNSSGTDWGTCYLPDGQGYPTLFCVSLAGKHDGVKVQKVCPLSWVPDVQFWGVTEDETTPRLVDWGRKEEKGRERTETTTVLIEQYSVNVLYQGTVD